MLILLVLSAGFCLATAQTPYDQLSDELKSYVDKALVKANREIASNGHLNYHQIGDSAVLRPRVNIEVHLKNTVCRKQAEHKHRPDCTFKKLEVRCRVCGRPGRHPMFIDCVQYKFRGTRHDFWAENCPPCDASCIILFTGVDQQ